MLPISIESILIKISELEREYQDCQGLILSEDDLKCQLFSKLTTVCNNDNETIDSGIKGSPLHSEINFFNEKGELKLRPDISIIEPNELSILHSVNLTVKNNRIYFERTSGKEFEFSGNTIIIELKFCKNKSGINSRHIKTYLKDIEKIQRLQNIINVNSHGNYKILGVFVIFNKTNLKASGFDDVCKLENESLRIFYGTGNLIL